MLALIYQHQPDPNYGKVTESDHDPSPTSEVSNTVLFVGSLTISRGAQLNEQTHVYIYILCVDIYIYIYICRHALKSHG